MPRRVVMIIKVRQLIIFSFFRYTEYNMKSCVPIVKMKCCFGLMLILCLSTFVCKADTHDITSLTNLVNMFELKIEKNKAANKNMLFLSYYHAKQYSKAVNFFKKEKFDVISNKEDSSLLASIYAESLLELGQQAYARMVLEKLNKVKQDDARVLYLLGKANVRAGDFVEGLKLLKKSASLDYAHAYYELALLTGTLEEKLDFLQKVLMLEPSDSTLSGRAVNQIIKLNEK